MTIREEDLLFDLCREYEKRRKIGVSHEEACQFQGLLPETDGFLEGLFGLTEELAKQGMVKIYNNSEYALTQKGIDYVLPFWKLENAYYTALEDMRKQKARVQKHWKPAAIWLAGLSIVMIIMTITFILVMKCSGT